MERILIWHSGLRIGQQAMRTRFTDCEKLMATIERKHWSGHPL
jgi:hypothetical protein